MQTFITVVSYGTIGKVLPFETTIGNRNIMNFIRKEFNFNLSDVQVIELITDNFIWINSGQNLQIFTVDSSD